jgi:hypothetical protein
MKILFSPDMLTNSRKIIKTQIITLERIITSDVKFRRKMTSGMSSLIMFCFALSFYVLTVQNIFGRYLIKFLLNDQMLHSCYT